MNRKQLQAARAIKTHKFLLYGGAMGGGKSHLLRWIAVWLLVDAWRRHGIRGMQAMICCESYPALHDRHIVAMEDAYPAWLGTWRKTDREFRLADDFGGGRICLRNLDNPAKYKSSQWPFILWDECTECGEQAFYDLGHRMRWPGFPTEETRMVLASNPGGAGHAWVQRRFILRQFRRGEKANEYAYVQAVAKDNPILDDAYNESLSALPEKLRLAYQEGRWDVFAGQAFSEFSPEIHVVDPFEIPRQFHRFRALDYGYSPGYTAAGWYAVDPVRGWLYLYRELYAQELTPAQVAERVVAMTPADETILYTVADPSLFRTNEQTRESNAMEMMHHGMPVVPAHNDRIAGWRRLHEYLRPFDAPEADYLPRAGERRAVARLRVFNICPEFIRTLPTMVHAETGNPEDVLKGGEDHHGDAARYAVMSRPGYETVEVDPERLRLAEAERIIREEEERDGRTKRRFSAGW